MVIAANVNKMASTKIKICIFHIVYLIFFILSKFLSFDFRLELDNTEKEKNPKDRNPLGVLGIGMNCY